MALMANLLTALGDWRLTWNLAFSLEMVLGLIQIFLQRGFAKQLEVLQYHRRYPDQSSIACLEQAPTYCCSWVYANHLLIKHQIISTWVTSSSKHE